MPAEAFELLHLLQRRASEGEGRILVIQGESGVGKTHIVKSFLRGHHDPEDTVLLSAKGRPGEPNPLYPVYEALADHLRTKGSSPRSLRSLFKEYATMLPRMAALLRPLLREDAYLRSVQAAATSPLFEASPYPQCLDLLRKLAATKTLVFWLDDFQWADRETLGFLMYLADRITGERMLWILCVNPRKKGVLDRGRLAATLAHLGNRAVEGSVAFHQCRPCTLGETKALMESLLGGSLIASDTALKTIFAKSRGVPYVLKTFVEVLRTNGTIVFAEGAFRIDATIDQLSLPDSLRTAIEERLRGVYRDLPGARPLLELAAVIGERFDESTLDSILQLCETYQLLVAIEDRHCLVRELMAQSLWEFDHVTVRDFIYDLLGARATHLHRQIAAHLAATESTDYSRIAYHYRHAGDTEFEITYTLKQAEQWIKQGFFAEARDAFDDLWALPEFSAHQEYRTRYDYLVYLRALTHFYLSEYDTCLQMLARLGRKGEQVDPLAVLLKAKCLNKHNLAQSFHQAVALLRGLEERLDVRSDAVLVGCLNAELVVALAHLNQFADAHTAFMRAERLLNPYEAPLEQAQLMRRSCIFFAPELAVRILRQAAEVFERHSVDHEVVKCLNNLGSIHLTEGNLRDAAQVLTKAIGRSARIGDFGMDYLLNNVALVRLSDGQPTEALEGLRGALAFAKRQVCRMIILNNQAAALLAMEEIVAAHELLERLLPEAEIVGEDVYLVGISLNLAIACIRSGRLEAALLRLLGCRSDRLRALGSQYDEQRSALISAVLEQLGAVAESGQRQRPAAGRGLVPHTIEMQFWGD